MQDEHQNLPNTDRLSVLAASILLAYALMPFIQIPERNLVFQVLGVLFVFKVKFSTIIAIITAGLAASGTSWLLRDHPRFRRGSPREAEVSGTPGPSANAASAAKIGSGSWGLFQHLLIPALTAWVIGVPLNSLAVGMQWWAVFGFGGLLLVLVLTSEYVAVDPYDTLHGPATVVLAAVSYALFLILIIALAAGGSRLYVLLPALGATQFLVTLRNLYLRLGGRWCFAWSAVITLIVGQVATALHYWPLSPLRYGLVILGLAYALASVAGSIEEGRPWRSLWFEPAIMLFVLWGLAAGLRG